MAARPRRKLVVVANRGPFRQQVSRGKRRWVRSSGGLVTALDPVLRNRGGVWVSAEEADDRTLPTEEVPHIEYETPTVKLSRSRQKGFYLGVSNAVLWPLLHSFPPTIRVGEAPWHEYVEANRAFAGVVLEGSKPPDMVWVHDYHLMLVPGMIRSERPRSRIGWFCHIPWPSPDLFRILPWRCEILEGLLGADIIGFQTSEYAQHFLECVERLTEHQVDLARMTVRAGSRTIRVVPAPIGIPVSDVQTISSDPEVVAEMEKIRHSVGNRRILIGVDRLDYTKGIPERILAYEQFLRRERSARNRFVFVQVMVPSRTNVEAYAKLKREVDQLVGDINGRYSSTGRVAIHYLFQSLEKVQLYAHYRAADVAVVTPLRDGMNLVAQEYVASRVEATGALVLSEFAGAAQYLPDAIQVNAYDIYAIADALQEAVSMSPEEMQRRMQLLRGEVLKLDVHRWADEYLEMLEKNLV